MWADVADDQDPQTKHPRGPNNEYPQLYTVDAVAYESVMVAFLVVLECDNYGKGGPCPGPKYHEENEVYLAFSRDGFHFSRPPAPRSPLAAVNTSRWNNWNNYDVQIAAGGFITYPDHLNMYVSGRYVPDNNGTQPCANPGCQFDTTGLASMRRDGFASLDIEGGVLGRVLTRPLVWSGEHRDTLYVNFKGSNLRAEIQNATSGAPIAPFTLANSVPFTGDSTRTKLSWHDAPSTNIGPLAGQAVRVLFEYGGSGSSSLFSFWVGDAECGASMGFVAGGGPGIPGDTDTKGSCT